MKQKISFFLSEENQPIQRMLIEAGHQIQFIRDKADVVLFPGGSDVCPFLYGEKPIKGTHFRIARDLAENSLFREIPRSTPKVGICRGAQFLCIMNGGRLWQDVDGHTRNHMLTDVKSKKEIEVTSTHHQMMRPGSNGKVLAFASLSKKRDCESTVQTMSNGNVFPDDPEVVWFEHERSLCFQPHPEYNLDSCANYFFEILEQTVFPIIARARSN